MRTVQALLAEAEAAGVRLRVENGKVRGRGPLPRGLKRELKRRREEIRAFLVARDGDTAEHRRIREKVDAEERLSAEVERARKEARKREIERRRKDRAEKIALALERARRPGCGIDGSTLEPAPGLPPNKIFYPIQRFL